MSYRVELNLSKIVTGGLCQEKNLVISVYINYIGRRNNDRNFYQLHAIYFFPGLSIASM